MIYLRAIFKPVTHAVFQIALYCLVLLLSSLNKTENRCQTNAAWLFLPFYYYRSGEKAGIVCGAIILSIREDKW